MPLLTDEVPEPTSTTTAGDGAAGLRADGAGGGAIQIDLQVRGTVGQLGDQGGIDGGERRDIQALAEGQIDPVNGTIVTEIEVTGSKHAREVVDTGDTVGMDAIHQLVDSDVREGVEIADDVGKGVSAVGGPVEGTHRESLALTQPKLQDIDHPAGQHASGAAGAAVHVGPGHLSGEVGQAAHRGKARRVGALDTDLELELLVPAPEHAPPVVKGRLADVRDLDGVQPAFEGGQPKSEAGLERGTDGGSAGVGREQALEPTGNKDKAASLSGGRRDLARREKVVGGQR